jgi:hypothetical protein
MAEGEQNCAGIVRKQRAAKLARWRELERVGAVNPRWSGFFLRHALSFAHASDERGAQ